MFVDSDKTTDVTIRFTNNLRGVVYDRFGDVMTNPIDARHFTITVPVVVNPQFFGWILGFGNQAILMRPKSVQKQLYEYLQCITSLYDHDC